MKMCRHTPELISDWQPAEGPWDGQIFVSRVLGIYGRNDCKSGQLPKPDYAAAHKTEVVIPGWSCSLSIYHIFFVKAWGRFLAL